LVVAIFGVEVAGGGEDLYVAFIEEFGTESSGSKSFENVDL
jgi:hypothetical protein